MHDGAVAGAVVGHDAFDADAMPGVKRDLSAQEAGDGQAFLVAEHLGVGQARASSTQRCYILPADLSLACCQRLRASWLAAAAVIDAHAIDASELLDVDVHEQLAARVGSGWLARTARVAALPQPIRYSTAETVEIGIPSSSLISAAVIRTRRSAAIAETRSSLVRPGTREGAEERSSSPALPSLR